MPLAGAIAQAQRLQSETSDQGAKGRASDIETTLKRLTRLSEKLIQLARAEGGRLRTGTASDLRKVLSLIVSDFQRTADGKDLDFIAPDQAVMSDIDPDAFGILCRNLIENALKYRSPNTPVKIRLAETGRLSVQNDCAPIEQGTLSRLTQRFERGTFSGEGSGVGLAIVRTIAQRADCTFTLTSPIEGQMRGIDVTIVLPKTPLLR